MSDNSTKAVSPVEYIVLLIVTQGMTFDEAFKKTNELTQKQGNQPLPRQKVAARVLTELEKIKGK